MVGENLWKVAEKMGKDIKNGLEKLNLTNPRFP